MFKTMLAILVVLIPSVVLAQDPPPNFVLVRVGSASETIITYNRTVGGDKALWFGLLNDTNFEPTYREWSVGLGWTKPSNQIFGLITKASDSAYFQIVDVLTITRGPLTLTAFVSGYPGAADYQQLQKALYCRDDAGCTALVQSGVCGGKLSWNVVFVRAF